MKKEVEKEPRFQAKYIHVTLHKLTNTSKNYWLEMGKTFRQNTIAVLVGLEENNEIVEGKEVKGIHAHIFIQFGTKQRLSRDQFVKHFGTDSIHVSTRQTKNDLLEGLGYVAKTGNTAQFGTFTYRGVEIDSDPEVYRFNYQVKTKLDAIKYFKKIIDETLQKDGSENIIKKYAKRKDAIGDYLIANPTVTNSLNKLAYTWYLDHENDRKYGFRFCDFVHDSKKLKKSYKEYLEVFPNIFEKNKADRSLMTLETDFADHVEHELKALEDIIALLNNAVKFGSRRPYKSLNLYLWSAKPSFGKTRLLSFLDEHMMAYRLPDDQYYVDYENDLYQVLVSDEAASFLKTKTYSHLKNVFEGRKVEFNLKGKEKVYKKDNPLLILADNISFEKLMVKCFYDRYEPEVMASRVMDIELKSRATLHFFIDFCLKTSTKKDKEDLALKKSEND